LSNFIARSKSSPATLITVVRQTLTADVIDGPNPGLGCAVTLKSGASAMGIRQNRHGRLPVSNSDCRLTILHDEGAYPESYLRHLARLHLPTSAGQAPSPALAVGPGERRRRNARQNDSVLQSRDRQSGVGRLFGPSHKYPLRARRTGTGLQVSRETAASFHQQCTHPLSKFVGAVVRIHAVVR